MSLVFGIPALVEIIEHPLVVHATQHSDRFDNGVQIHTWKGNKLALCGRGGGFSLFCFLGEGVHLRHEDPRYFEKFNLNLEIVRNG